MVNRVEGQTSCQQLHGLALLEWEQGPTVALRLSRKAVEQIFLIYFIYFYERNYNKERQFIIKVAVANHIGWISIHSDWQCRIGNRHPYLCEAGGSIQMFILLFLPSSSWMELANSNSLHLSCDYCVGLPPLTAVCLSTQCWASDALKEKRQSRNGCELQKCVETFRRVKDPGVIRP